MQLYLISILVHIDSTLKYMDTTGGHRTVANIQKKAFCKNSSRLKAVCFFRKTLYLRLLAGFCIRFQITSYLFLNLIYFGVEYTNYITEA